LKHKQHWLALGLLAAFPALASAKEYQNKWWLPSDYSTHGYQIDALFTWIFWITTITFIVVELMLVIFLIKYRHNPNKKKAVFTHGNQRLEMFWTIAPAIILAVLALGSKKVWDNFRYSDYENDPKKQTLLVVGQQFKWNSVYPGPDGKLGAYLVYPKPSDKTWSSPELYNRARSNAQKAFEGKPVDSSPLKPYEFEFANKKTLGPAYLPYDQARAAIAAYIDQVNPMGKVFEDPAGWDDDWEKQPGREITIAVNRPVEVQLSSKDVIHDFFLPNFRVKLDAVPGMRGKIFFQATKTSRDLEDASMKTYTFDELEAALARPETKDLVLRVNEASPGDPKTKNKDKSGWRYIDPAKPKASIARDTSNFPSDPERRKALYDTLKGLGITQVQAYMPGAFELVCEELCGLGHGTMRGQIRVVSQEELDSRKDYELYQKPTSRTLAPATQPTTKPANVAMGM
jgi:heme/copper-type cytochrome/quinol oxidase subunit 2